MKLVMTEELEMLRKSTQDLVEKELAPLEQEVEETGVVPQEIYNKLKDLGYYGVNIPEEYGGMGYGLLGYCVVTEELSKTHPLFNLEVGLNNGLGKGPLYWYGTDEQKNYYLPKFASGELTCAFALTEPDAGSDAAAILTKAEKRGNKWVINGTKHFISNGHNADIIMVIAKTNMEKGEVTAFIVEKGTPGFSVARRHKAMAGEEQAELVFEDCEVPEENIIGGVGLGFKAAMTALDDGRISVGAASLGLAKRLLKMSTEYSKGRVQFGKPIASFQAIQFMLAEMATDIYVTEQAVYNTAWRMDQGEKIPNEAAIVKLFASQMVCRAADHAVQIHGGQGYMREYPIERIYREVRVLRILEGTDEIQKIVIARNLLKG